MLILRVKNIICHSFFSQKSCDLRNNINIFSKNSVWFEYFLSLFLSKTKNKIKNMFISNLENIFSEFIFLKK